MQKAAPSKGGLMAFTVKKQKCMRCKTLLDDDTATLCAHCAPHEAEVYSKQLTIVNEAEEKFSRLWTQCQRCQGSLHADVLCQSKDCPIFYMRKRIQKDLKDATDNLARFGW